MNLYIFHYDNNVDFRDTHWAEALSEEEARIKLKGRDMERVGQYGTKKLGRSYKLVGVFPLLKTNDEAELVAQHQSAQQSPVNGKETDLINVVMVKQAAESYASLNSGDDRFYTRIAAFQAGVEWLWNLCKTKGSVKQPEPNAWSVEKDQWVHDPSFDKPTDDSWIEQAAKEIKKFWPGYTAIDAQKIADIIRKYAPK